MTEYFINQEGLMVTIIERIVRKVLKTDKHVLSWAYLLIGLWWEVVENVEFERNMISVLDEYISIIFIFPLFMVNKCIEQFLVLCGTGKT